MTRELVPAGRRELTRAHITFYRAVMDGVDIQRAWDVYLQVEGDFTQTLGVTVLQWVRQALISEALAAGEPGLIGLFRREPWRVKASGKPTLSEFASRFQDAGDFSEAELTEMWKEEFGGPDPAEARRERLSARLREALKLLERSTRRQPVASDSVSQWLAPNLAASLEAAGLVTLGAVRAALDARRTPRWEEVPGVGRVWADRLQAWFDEHGVVAPSSRPALPHRASAQLVPLERLARVDARRTATLLAPEWTPYPGTNNALGADDDKHAVELWLAAKATNPNTLRVYRKNAERLLLWCRFERGVTFPQLKVEDCIHYRTWLSDLGRKSPAEWAAAGWKIPAKQWFGPRAAKRDSEDWRPFEGALSPSSAAADLMTVRSLFEFLLRGRVVEVNSWDLLGKRTLTRAKLADATRQFTSRSFSLDQWRHLLEGLDPEGPEPARRLLLVLWLGFACGLRTAEMVELRLGSLLPGAEDWRLDVLGKGNKERTVPLPSPARDALLRYLDVVGIPFAAVVAAAVNKESPLHGAPVLRGQHGRRSETREAPTLPLRQSGLYRLLKGYLQGRAADLERTDPVAASKFRLASTHWLRHTCATLALKDGVPINDVQALLGHSTLTTTSTYVTAQQEAMQRSMEAFAAKSAS